MFHRLAESLPAFLSFFTSMFGKTSKHWNASIWEAFRNWVEGWRQAMQRRFFLFALPLFFLCVPGLAGGQVAPGFPSFVPQDCHGVDCVDLLNNNVSLNIPVMSKAGAVNFGLSLNGSYYISLNSATTTWQPSQLLAAQFAPLTQASSSLGLDSSGHTSGTLALCPDEQSHTTEMSGFYIVVGGTYHYLPPADFVDIVGCWYSSITDTVTDNSGYTATFTKAGLTALYDSAGNSVGSGSITDPNGNSITYSSTSYTYTDTLGVTALTAGSGNFPNYTWTDVNSGSPQVSFTTSSTVHLKSVFGCSGVYDFDVTNQTLPSAINFPDGTSLGITYEGTSGYTGDYTGRLNQITLREGGTVAYTYGGSNYGLNCTYQTVPTLTRKLGNGDTTTYTLAYSLISGSNYKATNTVVDPGGNKTVYTFTGFSSTGNSSTYAQVVTEVQRYQGTSTLLTTDIYCYNTAFASCSTSSAPTAQVSGPIGEIVVFHQISGMSKYSATDTKYDYYGNVWYSARYDFGGATPAGTTTITYGSCSASCNTSSPTISSIGSNIYNKPGKVVTTQNGSTVAQANYTYDAHGNLLSTSVWNGSAFIGQTTANSYNSNGTVATSYDLANNETTYAYTPGSYSDGSCTNYPFPTKVTNVSTGLYAQASYDCTGGVKLTGIDPSGNTTTYGYKTSTGTADPYWRVSSVTDPLSNIAYRTYPTGTSPNSSGSSFTFNSGNSVNATTIYTDGYGRPTASQTGQAPGQGLSGYFDTVSRSNGWSGNSRQVQASQVCSTAWVGYDGSCTLVHTNEYDPLGRLLTESTTSNETLTHTYTQNDDLAVLTPAPTGENSKQVQTEYDGLGRVSKVCHIGSTASTGSGTACGQNTGSANGATDAYTYTQTSSSPYETEVYIKRSGSQQRTSYFDGLGRMVSKTTPEGGTWTSTFDTNSSCPSGYRGAVGQLASVSDPNGNLICYKYDALNRVTGINANGTTCRHFYYDTTYGTVPTGVSTPTYTLGRLAEDSTDNCSGTLITDEWHSYDKDGRETDYWQSTPHSTQYYHSTATFYDNGKVKTLQLASPSEYTMSYGLDGEGRWDTLTDTTLPQNIVTGPTTVGGMYDPAGHVLNVQLTGNTPDQDIYTYDPNTGNMKTFEFEVGNTPANLTGTITWNQNRTVQQVGVVDGFNSGGSSTCTSNSSSSQGYDDWGRLMLFDCGSGNVGEAYTYDVYDNLSSAPLSGRTGWTWSPGYSIYNQCTGCTYDSNGNMTSDGSGSNSFQWNEFSKLKSWIGSGTPTCGTSGKCITYDAFGRAVEFSNGSTWTEIWYPQIGKVGMSGATLSYAYWPSPGRGTVVVNGTSTFTFMHQDWLGNDRVVSSINNHTEIADRDYTPYGGQQFNAFGSSNPVYGLYAGITGDFNAGVLWDTPNRELATYGRWLSPDPAGAGWNQYAYSTNPNSESDPSGLCPWCGAGPGAGPGGGGLGGSFNGYCPIGFGVSAPCNAVDPSLFGNLLYDLPGYQNPSAEAMHVYTSCLSYNFHCDANGNYSNPDYLTQANGQYSRLSGNLLKDFGPGVSADPTKCVLGGGHCNFLLSCDSTQSICPSAGRYDNGIHIEDDNGALWVHDDSVSPWTGNFSFSDVFTSNFWEHTFVDLIGGTFFVGAFAQ